MLSYVVITILNYYFIVFFFHPTRNKERRLKYSLKISHKKSYRVTIIIHNLSKHIFMNHLTLPLVY